MRGEPRPLDREHEILRRLVAPAPEARRFLRAVEGAVDLDRGELPAGVFELAHLGQVFRIERAAPGREHPAADADADHAVSAIMRNPMFNGSMVHLDLPPWLLGRSTLLEPAMAANRGVQIGRAHV